jgi:chromosomal replication initiator protein
VTAPLRRISIAEIKRSVADEAQVPLRVIDSPRRDREATRPCQLAMALAYHLTSLSSPAVARHFNDCDHTTILHARDRIRARREVEPDLDRIWRRLEARLAPQQPHRAELQLDFLPGPLFDFAQVAA